MPDVLLTMFDGIYLESVIHHAGVDTLPHPSPPFVSDESGRIVKYYWGRVFFQHFRLNHFLSYSKIKLSWPGALEDVWKVDYLDSYTYRQSVSWSRITQDAAADYLRLLYKRCNNSQTKRFSKDE